MSKVFISFLGASDYKICNYCFKPNGSEQTKKIEKVEYVQEALIKLFCTDYSHDDRFVFFLTDLAREKNWLDKGPHKGLKQTIEELRLRAQISEVHIPESRDVAHVWEVFRIVFDQLEKKNEVIIDMTHAFRFLPMLSIVLMEYARVLKQVKVSGIYYGAFEAMGYAPNEVETIPIEERNAPIFDLTSFHTLQLWSVAADQFVNSGKVNMLKTLQVVEVGPVRRKAQGENKTVIAIHNIINQLQAVVDDIETCRGRNIQNAQFIVGLKKNLHQLKTQQRAEGFQAFAPLIEEIEKKIEPFHSGELANGFRAVKWCIDHDLAQQGITLLQETVLAFFHKQVDWTETPELNKDFDQKKFLTSLFSVPYYQERYTNTSGYLKNYEKYRDVGDVLLDRDDFKACCEAFKNLSDARNDINHGGFSVEARQPESIKKELKKAYETMKMVLFRE